MIPTQKRGRSQSLKVDTEYPAHLKFLSRFSESQDVRSLTIKDCGAEKFSQEDQGRNPSLERLNSRYLDYGFVRVLPNILRLVVLLKKILDFSLGSL